MTLDNAKKYAYLLRTFRNGMSLVHSMRKGVPCDRAVLWSGRRLTHPSNRNGFVGTILEVWHEQCYVHSNFYTPKDGDVILDVGAHVGLFSLQMARLNPRCRVVAFEPSPENYPCLVWNTQSSGAAVEAHCIAIGGEPGWGQIHPTTDRSIDHQLHASLDSSDHAVPVETLSQMCHRGGAERFALLKMDVEGHEFDVLSSASSETLNRFDRIVLEYHDHLRPGVLALALERLRGEFDVQVEPTLERGYGVLLATHKSLRKEAA